MNFVKRMLAMVLAVLMVLTVTGCSGNSATEDVVASHGDRSVSGALYMRFFMDAYALADTYKDDPEADLLRATVEGIPAVEWIEKTVKDDISRYLVCMEEFEKTDMVYSDEDKQYVEDYSADMMEQYADIFEVAGIDMQALKDYYEYNIKSMALFHYYYAEGGVKAVPLEELKEEMRSTYNMTKVLIFDKALITVDADGKVIEPTEEEIAEAKAKAEAYYNRALAGEDFEELIIEWELDLFGEENIGHSHEEGGSHDLITVIGGSDVPEAYSSVMDNAPYGEPKFIEDADVYYVAVRYDIAENEYNFESYRSTILLTMRSEDYRTMSDEWIAAANINYNTKALKNYTTAKVLATLSGLAGSN